MQELTWEMVRQMIEVKIAVGTAKKEDWLLNPWDWAEESLGNWTAYQAGYLLRGAPHIFCDWHVVEGNFRKLEEHLNKLYGREMEALCKP